MNLKGICLNGGKFCRDGRIFFKIKRRREFSERSVCPLVENNFLITCFIHSCWKHRPQNFSNDTLYVYIYAWIFVCFFCVLTSFTNKIMMLFQSENGDFISLSVVWKTAFESVRNFNSSFWNSIKGLVSCLCGFNYKYWLVLIGEKCTGNRHIVLIRHHGKILWIRV